MNAKSLQSKSNAFDEYINEIEDAKSSVDDLTKKLEAAKQRHKELISNPISIKLSDLVYEISKILDVNVLDMNIKITTNMFLGDKNKFKLDIVSKRIQSKLEVAIDGGKQSPSPFKLHMYFPLDFSSKFVDGSILFDHCSLLELNDCYEVIVNKQIGGLICSFSMENLLNGTGYISSQSDLLKEAVKNCYNNDKLIKKEITEQSL